MLFAKTAAPILLLLGAGSAFHISKTHSIHEKRDSTPTEWNKLSRSSQNSVLQMRIQMTHQNIDLAHDHLMAVSDPDSSDFGKHWTPKKVHDFFSPSAESVSEIQEWLDSSGIGKDRHKVAPSRNYVKFEATVQEVESLLKTEYSTWEHHTGSRTTSCDEYHVPENVKHHIDFISPTIGLVPHPKNKHSKRSTKAGALMQRHSTEPPTNLTDCSEVVSPQCIRALYKVPLPTTAVPGNDLGMYEAGNSWAQGDLNDFFYRYAPEIPNGTHPINQLIDGAIAPQPGPSGGEESDLDFEVAFPLVYPQGIKVFQVPGENDEDEDSGIFDPFLDAVDASYCSYDGGDDPRYDFPTNRTECGIYNSTNVVSFSYAIAESFYGSNYEVRQCHEYLKLGLMGKSLIFASGDNGTVSRDGSTSCLANGAGNPNFPATCPYVTTVGATQILPNATVNTPEVAVLPSGSIGVLPIGEVFTSGGGFSNVFPRPSYQNDSVLSFLKNNTSLPPLSTFNISGRAFPDVSANGWNILTWTFEQYFLNYGTSASTPIFASIINRLNGERMKIGKRPVGFLNPLLYKHKEMFGDVTEGCNLGCDGKVAFRAREGWDPVTGLGTPHYEKMLEVFLGLP